MVYFTRGISQHVVQNTVFVPTCKSNVVFAAADYGLAQAPSGMEDLREKGELQKAYYGFLHAITSSSLSHVLLQTPSETLHQALGALVAGGADHIDPGIRKTCLQVWALMLSLRLHGMLGMCCRFAKLHERTDCVLDLFVLYQVY